MSTEYTLSYTGAEINEKLGKIDSTILVTKQTLTDEQKSQARANIGAGTSSVKLATDLRTSSKAADAKLAGDAIASAAHSGYIFSDGALISSTMQKYMIMMNEPDKVFDDYFVRVFDDAPTMSNLENGYSIVIGEPIVDSVVTGLLTDTIEVLPKAMAEEQFVACTQEIASGVYMLGEGMVVIVTSDFTDGEITLKKGVYFNFAVNALKVNGYSFGGINNLLETIKDIVETAIGETLTFDGLFSTEEYVSIINDSIGTYGFVRVSNSVPTITDLVSTSIITINNGNEITGSSLEFVDHDNYIEIFDLYVNDSGSEIRDCLGFIIKKDNSTIQEYGTFPKKGVYFLYTHNKSANKKSFVSSLYVPNYNFTGFVTEEKKTIKEQYLPESVENVIIRSSTKDSTKKFKITVDDSGTITATEVTE